MHAARPVFVAIKGAADESAVIPTYYTKEIYIFEKTMSFGTSCKANTIFPFLHYLLKKKIVMKRIKIFLPS